MNETTRRRFLRISGLTGVTAGAGCLRLTQDQPQSSPENRTPSTELNSEDGISSTESNSKDEPPSIESLYEIQWERETLLDNLSLSNGYLYADGFEIIKIEQSSGDIVWESEPKHKNERWTTDLIAMDEYIFVLGGGVPDEDIPTRLFALDSQNGTERWFFEGEFVEWQGLGQLAASDDYVAFVESSQNGVNIIRMFRSDAASPIWKKEYGENSGYINEIHIRGNKIFVLGESLRVLDVNSGELLQTNENTASRGVITESNIYIGDREIRKLSRSKLESEWTFSPISRITANPQVVTGEQSSIIVPSAFGLECVNVKNGELRWKYRTASEILDIRGGVEVVSGFVWAWDNAGFLYVIDAETGEVLFDQQQKNNPAATSDLKADASALYISFTSGMDTMLPSGASKLSITGIGGG